MQPLSCSINVYHIKGLEQQVEIYRDSKIEVTGESYVTNKEQD